MKRILSILVILGVTILLFPACARRVSSPTNGVQTYPADAETTRRAYRPAAPQLTESEVTGVLQKVLDELPGDLVQFAPPTVLTQGEAVRIEARMARPLLEDVNKALLTKGWKVDALVGAHLSGDRFEFHNLGPEDQMVGSQEITVWAWDAKPLAAGEQILRLNTTFRVVTASGAQFKALPVMDRRVSVVERKTGGFLKFLQSYWAWILGVVLVAGIVAILVIEPSNKPAKKG